MKNRWILFILTLLFVITAIVRRTIGMIEDARVDVIVSVIFFVGFVIVCAIDKYEVLE